jgi:hypothetical protein
MNQSLTTRLSNIAGIVVAIIIILLPFHEFLTTWAASNFNHYDLLRVWKEILIFLLTPVIIYITYKTPAVKKWLKNSWLVRLTLSYILLNIGLGIWSYKTARVNKITLADGLITDLRFPIFFIFTAVIAYHSKFLKKYWQQMLLLPATIVVAFGLAQLFLPLDFLKHFGYGPKTIPPYETVDQKTQYHRIQSTLRGPNPLGAYLILIISACFIYFKKYKWPKLILAICATTTLFFTYSRSAYVGLALSLVILYYLLKLNKKWHKQFLIICGAIFIALALLVVSLRYNSVAQNVLFHTSNSSKSPDSSNAQRISGLEAGLREVVHQPYGEGPGTAGPASEHNITPPRIAENYYVQIAQETGWIGLLIFLSINVIVAVKLWQKQKDPLACLLFASFIGISIVNLVSHEWADDTLSLIWWGMAGITLAPDIIEHTKRQKINT